MHWFEKQTREDQIRLLAYRQVVAEDAEEGEKSRRKKRDPKYDSLLAAAQEQGPKTSDEYMRQRAQRLQKLSQG